MEPDWPLMPELEFWLLALSPAEASALYFACTTGRPKTRSEKLKTDRVIILFMCISL